MQFLIWLTIFKQIQGKEIQKYIKNIPTLVLDNIYDPMSSQFNFTNSTVNYNRSFPADLNRDNSEGEGDFIDLSDPSFSSRNISIITRR